MTTFLAIRDAYLERKRLGGTSERSVQKFRVGINAFIRRLEANFGIKSPGSVTADHVGQWIGLLHSTPSQHTGLPRREVGVAIEIRNVRMFCKFAVKRGEMAAQVLEPFYEFRAPKCLPRPTPSHALLRKFLRSLPTNTPRAYMYRTIAEVLYTTGIRPLELVGIDCSDVDVEHGLIKVMGKGRRERLVPIGRTALRFLTTYVTAVRPRLVRDPQQRALWVNSFGRRMDYQSLRYTFGRHLRANPSLAPITAYTFRHACATEMVRSGANLWAVKDLLGHNGLEMLKHYVHLTVSDLQKIHARCHPRDNGVSVTD